MIRAYKDSHGDDAVHEVLVVKPKAANSTCSVDKLTHPAAVCGTSSREMSSISPGTPLCQVSLTHHFRPVPSKFVPRVAAMRRIVSIPMRGLCASAISGLLKNENDNPRLTATINGKNLVIAAPP